MGMGWELVFVGVLEVGRVAFSDIYGRERGELA